MSRNENRVRATLLASGVITATVAAVFWLHRAFLRQGFYQDDFWFVHTIRPLTLTDAASYFNPRWGWFYRPVFLIYFALMRRAFGVQSVAFHAGSLLLHSLALLLLMGLVRRLAGNKAALLSGLLFLVYPGKGEAVWWIASASTLLAACFSLLTLHGWLSWRRNPSAWRLGLTLLAFCAALLSKEDAVSLPVVLLLFDWYACPRAPLRRRMVLLPFAALTAGYLALDIIAYRVCSAGGTSAQLWAWEPLSRLSLTLGFTYQTQLGHLLNISWLAVSRAGEAALLGALGLWAWGSRLTRTLWLWGLATALPIPLATGVHVWSERFAYLPALPASALMAAALVRLWQQAAGQRERFAGAALATALTVPFVTGAAHGNNDAVRVWETLFVTTGAAVIVWRAGAVSGRGCALIAGLAVLTQCDMLFDTGWPLLWPGIAVTLCAALMGRAFWKQGAIAALLLWPEPACSLPLFLTLLAVQGRQPAQYAGAESSPSSSM